MTRREDNASLATHRFAWDGLSFDVPDHWQLAEYAFARATTRISMEDDYAVRLTAEWLRPKKNLQMAAIQRKYEKAAKKLTAATLSVTELPGLPDGWTAFLYTLPERRQLVTAFLLGGSSKLFCFLQVHFSPEDGEKPDRVIERIATTFRIHDRELIPWALYDMSIHLPRDFRLIRTSLQAGRKLLVFYWRFRMFYIWHCSLADLVLKGRPCEKWAADFLNAYRPIRGPTFVPGEDGVVHARRTWPYRFGHYDEIGRLCFRYRVRYLHDRPNNHLILWVYNYRSDKDLSKLPKNIIDINTP